MISHGVVLLSVARRNFQRSVTAFRGEDAIVRVAVTDDDLMMISGDHTVHVRDLSLLHASGLEKRQRMDILVRDRSLLVRLLHVNALLQRDQAVLFNADSFATQELAMAIASQTKKASQDEDNWERSYEAVALDVILHSVVKRLDHRLSQLQPLAFALLREMEDNISSEGLRKLLPVKEMVGQLKTHTQEVGEVLKSVVTHDDSLQRLNLSELAQPDMASPETRRSTQIMQAERLLEYFRREVGDVGRDVELLDERIDDTREVVNVALDNQRNRILQFNMELSCVTVALATCALPAGIFGMNMVHGLEEHALAFPTVVTGTVCVSALLFIVLSRYLRQGIARSSRTTADEIKALRGVLSMLDDIEAVFHQKAVQEINRDEFRRELLKATGRKISEQEMDVICRAFDDDHDGHLQLETFQQIRKDSKSVLMGRPAS